MTKTTRWRCERREETTKIERKDRTEPVNCNSPTKENKKRAFHLIKSSPNHLSHPKAQRSHHLITLLFLSTFIFIVYFSRTQEQFWFVGHYLLESFLPLISSHLSAFSQPLPLSFSEIKEGEKQPSRETKLPIFPCHSLLSSPGLPELQFVTPS